MEVREPIVMAIFAKRGTTEKTIIPMFRSEIHDTMVSLNRQYGGDWVFCEALKPGEGIKFTDTSVYRGFSPNIKRYSDAIIEVKPF